MEEKTRDFRVCKDCQAPSYAEFKKVAGLKNSDLQIFVHKEKDTSLSVEKRSSRTKKVDTFVLHNAGDKDLKRADYIKEMCQFRKKCFQCRKFIQRAHSLLDEITDIKKNQVLGICEHCKHANPAGNCRRCELIVNKFLSNKNQQYQERENRFKSWLCKVHQLLHSILETENVCNHRLYKESSTLELEKLLQELKSPLEMRQPDITFFPTGSGPFGSMTQNKEMLEEILIKLKSESLKKRSDDSLFVSPSMTETSPTRKYLVNKNFEGKPTIEVLPSEGRALSGSKSDLKTLNNLSKESNQIISTEGYSEDKALSKEKNAKETYLNENAKLKTSEKPRKENDTPGKELKEKKIINTEGYSEGKRLSKDKNVIETSSKEIAKLKTSKEKPGKANGTPGQDLKEKKIISTEDYSEGKRLSKDKNVIETSSKNMAKLKSSKEKPAKENKSPGKELKQKKNISTEGYSEGKILSKDKNVKETSSKDMAKLKTSKEKPKKENDSPDEEPMEKKTKEGKTSKPKLTVEDKMMLKMIEDLKKKKNAKEKTGQEKEIKKKFAKVDSLPQLTVREFIEVIEEKPESVVECGEDEVLPAEMIKRARVVPFDSHYKQKDPDPNPPLLFKIKAVCSESKIEKDPIISTTPPNTILTQEEVPTKGVIKYALSNKEFIDKGWTILPTKKVLRRMNIYRMEPANPKYDWFERHKHRKMMFYDTSEKLAEIDDNGRGKWFYKKGMVALDYYNAQDLHAGQRYVVYSSGEEMENGKNKPVTVLASFDFLGNGVVYDHNGKVRIKYNQTEGMVIDEKIGPPGRWKWHSLNEPPVLQQVFIDTHDSYTCSDHLLNSQTSKRDKSEIKSKQDIAPNDEMLAIEFKNFVKAKADKLLQKFKPFQIRMKVLKINDQFSLRILDQADIYLLFRDGHVSLKLNLGMQLVSSEIVDTNTAEVSAVATPYDRFPPTTPSIAEIQSKLRNARRIGKKPTANSISEKKSIDLNISI